MKLLIQITSIVVFLFSAQIGFTQRPGGSYGAMPELSISGSVIDLTTNQIMEYATISLLKTGETTPVNGAITDLEGNFIITGVKPGNYRVEASFIGFDTKTIEDIKVSPKTPNVDLGTIALSIDAENIQEVEIITNRSNVRYEIDKKIVSVDKQLVAQGGNATDVLATVPSIQVDIDGNVKLRGKSGFTVLIDGKPSVLDANEALQQIPASNIENIEIITNPSAKYDAEGAAGIINIILKKQRETGVAGVINARVGTFKNYGVDGTITYTKNKLTLTASANARQSRNVTDNEQSFINTINGFDYETSAVGVNSRSFQNRRVNLGLEYRVSEMHSFSVKGSYGTWRMVVDDDEDIMTTDEQGIDFYSNEQDTKRGSEFYRIAGNYDLKVNEQHKLSFGINYNKSDFFEEVLNDQTRLDLAFDGTKSEEGGPTNRMRANVDYTYQVNDSSSFEFGFLQELGKSDESNSFFNLDPSTDTYIEVPEFAQSTLYEKNIRAFYGIFKSKYGKLGYQFGVRSEFTDRLIEADPGGTATVKRTDLFPSAYLSYDLNDRNQLFLNYSKRINRPRGWFLEPNSIFLDANTIWRGNPEILPVYTHSFEAGWLRYLKEKGTYNVQMYYQYDQNNVEFVRTPFSENITLEQPQNVGNAHYLGLEQSFEYPLTKWWELNIGVNTSFLKVNGEIEGESIEKTDFRGMGNINNYFTVTNNTKVQFDFRYYGGQATAQGLNYPSYGFNLGFRQSLLKKSLTLGFNWNDIFNTYTAGSETNITNYSYRDFSDQRYPKLNFTVSYRINNYKNNSRDNDEVGEL